MSAERSATSDAPLLGERHEDEPIHRPFVGAFIALCFAAVLALAFVHLPREQAPLSAVARYAVQVAEPKWGTTEPVNEVVYGTRGFDTFGETFLLLAAVACVTMLARPKEARRGFLGEHQAGEREQAQDDPASGGGNQQARQAESAETATPSGTRMDTVAGLPTPDWQPLGTYVPVRAQAMTVVVRVATRLASPVLAVAGIYLAAWGYSPGGGFPAGAVLAGVALLVYAAFGYAKVAHVVRPGVLEPLELAGALVIIACETLGLVLKGSFSANWLPIAPIQTIRSGGILQLFSGGELIEVATGLALVIFAILGMGHDWTPDEEDGTSDTSP